MSMLPKKLAILAVVAASYISFLLAELLYQIGNEVWPERFPPTLTDFRQQAVAYPPFWVLLISDF